ncbi:MAG: histidine--tRNA ligase family protein [Bdellovibrionales bacterium]|nr:histidine--tRNA ligase family protein [Bdellovibrionales bacterium]
MSKKRRCPIKKAVSGFPEWQPKVKAIEEKWLRRISTHARRNGFLPVETASVEHLSTLEIKGEIDKEIYCLTKPGDKETSKELALHYDLTIPLARYVTEHFSRLAFPFKRYQIQKVWRGERPQFGRYREFYQADIDVIDAETLPALYDAEVVCVGVESMLKMRIAPFKVGVSNRKIYEGYLRGLGVENTVPVLRLIDKLEKIGTEGVAKLLVETCGMSAELARKSLALAALPKDADNLTALATSLGVSHPVFEQGLAELQELLNNVKLIGSPRVQEVIYPDLSFVRGFDYYTGSIFEGKFTSDDTYGSICSGGRYDNLAEGFGNKKLPGVGFSIGVTRIMAKESLEPEKMRDYPKYVSDFCLILDAETADSKPLIAAGNELKRLRHSVNTVSVGKLKKGLQVAARTEAAVAMFMFDGKLVLKHLGTGQQVDVAAGNSVVQTAQALLNSR